VAVGTVAGIAAQIMFDIRALSRSIFVVDAVLLTVLLLGLSYVIDRGIDAVRRNRKDVFHAVGSHLAWGAIAGAAGVLSMLYALSFVWPRVFLGHTFELLNILLAAWFVRMALFPLLLRRLPRNFDFVETVTRRARPILGHMALVFVADITTAFFLNIRSYSRSAVMLNAVFYGLMVVLLLALRCALNRHRRTSAPAPAAPEARRVLVVGEGREVGLLLTAVREAGSDAMEAVGVVMPNPDHRTGHVEGVDVVGTPGDLPVILERKRPSTVIVLNHSLDRAAVRRVARASRNAGVDIRFVPSIMRFVEGTNGDGLT
jgi:FlaA1/EpsC-like NDP-sugar epimerase